MHLTDNQLKIMRALQEKNPDGSYMDLDQLLDILATDYDWVTTKAALQWSLRKLIAMEVIERLGKDLRRHRSRRILRLTELGDKVMGPARR